MDEEILDIGFEDTPLYEETEPVYNRHNITIRPDSAIIDAGSRRPASRRGGVINVH